MADSGGKHIRLRCLRGTCGQLPVVLGAAPAKDLYRLSFADLLDEGLQVGYQRPFDPRHSREFREYIEQPGASTIPLTFNLRGVPGDGWSLEAADSNSRIVDLCVREPAVDVPSVMAQVDCQHRLGSMKDSNVELTFQCFLGLSDRDEMAIFNVINGKAKGLSSSLLDYHTTKLAPGPEALQLELYIAKALHDDAQSVWCGKLVLGGSTPGTKRRVSLRSLQVATKLMLQRSPLGSAPQLLPEQKYEIVRAFWKAVSAVWGDAWEDPRKHLITKGVGVTALNLLGAELLTAIFARGQRPDVETFVEYLTPLSDVDWASGGSFKGFGGRQGAAELHKFLSQKLFAPGIAIARVAR